MKCSVCGCDESSVLRSDDGRRRRECSRCRHRWTTIEVDEATFTAAQRAAQIVREAASELNDLAAQG